MKFRGLVFLLLFLPGVAFAGWQYDSSYKGDNPDASEIAVDVTAFANNLTMIDDTVQKALDTLDDISITGIGDARYLKLDSSNGPLTGDLVGKDFVSIRSGTITRNGSGFITQIAKTGGRTLTITRDGNNYVSTIADGTYTWTITRNGSNYITSWTVSP